MGGAAVSESDSEGQQHLLSSSQFRQAKKHYYSTPGGLRGKDGGKQAQARLRQPYTQTVRTGWQKQSLSQPRDDVWT